MNIWQRLVLIERRIAVLEQPQPQPAAASAPIYDAVKATRLGSFSNDIKPDEVPTSKISDRMRQNGAYPVNRNGKVYWRMPAGAPLSALQPQSRKQRLKDTTGKHAANAALRGVKLT